MKTVGWVIGILVVLAAGAIGYVAYNSGDLIKTAIESLGPDFLGAEVSVDEINLQLAQGSAQVKSLRIGNPAGFDGPYAMKIDEVKVTLDIEQIAGDLIVIKQLVVDGASLAAQARGQRTNFQQLMDNLDQATASDSNGEVVVVNDATPKFIVDVFTFTGANVSLVSDLAGDMDLNIPDIRLTDLGRKSNGATAAELAQQIMRPITAAISQAAVSQGLDLDGVKANVTEKVREKLGGGLKSLTDRLKK